MKLIKYDPKYRQDFIDFNTAWIEDNFGHLEPEDYETFEHIEDEIKDGYTIEVAPVYKFMLGKMARRFYE